MELKEFVKTVLTDITDAVSELQAELQNGAIVSPSLPYSVVNTTIDDVQNNSVRRISEVKFDVAITAESSDKSESGMKLGIQVLSAKIGSGSNNHTENVSRVTFSIPVVLPTLRVKTKEDSTKRKAPKRPVYDDV